MAKKKKARELKAAARKDIKLFRARAIEAERRASESSRAASEAAAQLSMTVNSILATVAERYGEKLDLPGPAVYELKIPKPAVIDTCEKYDIKTSVDPLTDMFVIHVTSKDPKQP